MYGQTVTYQLQDASRSSTALWVLAKHSGLWNAARSDEHVQKFWWWSPEHLLQELQSSCDHVVIPVLGVMKGQLIHLETDIKKTGPTVLHSVYICVL